MKKYIPKLITVLIFLIPGIYQARQNTNTISNSNSFLLLFPFLFLLMYILLIRPQTKKANEHKNLLDNLKINDEIVTHGGMIGKITKIKNQFIILSINANTEIIIKKNSIIGSLPKGTIKEIK